jgi:phosphoglucosamine mutase
VAVVGGDSRLSTPMLEAAFVAGLASEGVEVHRLGVTPTPAVAFEAARIGAMGAVISASHNPYHDNGIKLFAPGGTKLPDRGRGRDRGRARRARRPHRRARTDPRSRRLGRRVRRAPPRDARRGRDLVGLRIVVDAANGAASHLAAEVFGRTGAQVVVINDRPNGTNINAGCGATEPEGLRRSSPPSGRTSGSRSTVTPTGSSRSTSAATSSTATTSSRSAPPTCATAVGSTTTPWS